MSSALDRFRPIITKHKKSRAWWKRRLKYNLTAYLFILPTLIGFSTFMAIPSLSAFGLSLTEWNILGTQEFVGLTNYFDLVFGDPVFWHSLWLTVLYTLYEIPIQLVIALFLAIQLNKGLRGTGVFRTVLVMPWITTPVAVGLMWKWILDPNFGLLVEPLSWVGIHAPPILNSVGFALPSIALVNIWRFTGYKMMLFLAGLQAIPSTVYEAAAIDGATGFKRTWHIILPLLRPATMFVVITSLIGSFQIFDTVFIMTQGGPGDATRVYYFYLYENAFRFFKMGYASAMSVLLFLIIMSMTLLQYRYFRSQITYDLT